MKQFEKEKRHSNLDFDITLTFILEINTSGKTRLQKWLLWVDVCPSKYKNISTIMIMKYYYVKIPPFLRSRACFAIIVINDSRKSGKKCNGRRIDDYATPRNEQSAACRQEAAGSIVCSCNRRETRLTGLSIFITSESCSFELRGAVVGREFIRCWIYMVSTKGEKKRWEKRDREVEKAGRTSPFIFQSPI